MGKELTEATVSDLASAPPDLDSAPKVTVIPMVVAVKEVLAPDSLLPQLTQETPQILLEKKLTNAEQKRRLPDDVYLEQQRKKEETRKALEKYEYVFRPKPGITIEKIRSYLFNSIGFSPNRDQIIAALEPLDQDDPKFKEKFIEAIEQLSSIKNKKSKQIVDTVLTETEQKIQILLKKFEKAFPRKQKLTLSAIQIYVSTITKRMPSKEQIICALNAMNENVHEETLASMGREKMIILFLEIIKIIMLSEKIDYMGIQKFVLAALGWEPNEDQIKRAIKQIGAKGNPLEDPEQMRRFLMEIGTMMLNDEIETDPDLSRSPNYRAVIAKRHLDQNAKDTSKFRVDDVSYLIAVFQKDGEIFRGSVDDIKRLKEISYNLKKLLPRIYAMAKRPLGKYFPFVTDSMIFDAFLDHYKEYDNVYDQEKGASREKMIILLSSKVKKIIREQALAKSEEVIPLLNITKEMEQSARDDGFIKKSQSITDVVIDAIKHFFIVKKSLNYEPTNYKHRNFIRKYIFGTLDLEEFQVAS